MRSSLGFGIRTATAALVSLACVAAASQSVKDVVVFNGSNAFGNPIMTPAQGRDAKIYGTTYGSKVADGSIFSLSTEGAIHDLYTFGYANGAAPEAGLFLATDGNFYGTAATGGAFGLGVLFETSADGIYTVLHDFSGSDGAGPTAPPVQASDGNLYGTTSGDGGVFPATIYKYTMAGAFSTIFQFNNSQGKFIYSPLIQASDGNLYGLAQQGGTYDNGTIFEVSTSGSLLSDYSFLGGKEGAFPFGGLIQASDGNFYGATNGGGNSRGYGTIFKMDQTGAVSVLYEFKGGSDGYAPLAGLMQATDGNLYGTTALGGNINYGTIYRISTAGVYKHLYSFTAKTGENPSGALLQHTNGLFYGATEYGGTYSYGVIYSLNMGLDPFVAFVQPVGKVGKSTEILGQGLTGASQVTFNGIAATSFRVVSDTYMTAVVPLAATTGPVVVTTPAGPLTSNVNFTISK